MINFSNFRSVNLKTWSTKRKPTCAQGERVISTGLRLGGEPLTLHHPTQNQQKKKEKIKKIKKKER